MDFSGKSSFIQSACAILWKKLITEEVGQNKRMESELQSQSTVSEQLEIDSINSLTQSNCAPFLQFFSFSFRCWFSLDVKVSICMFYANKQM